MNSTKCLKINTNLSQTIPHKRRERHFPPHSVKTVSPQHHTLQENYRQVSLINTAAEILNTSTLNAATHKTYVHQNQVEFVPEIQDWFNIQKTHAIYH